MSELFQTSSAPFIQTWTTLQYQWTLELLILHPASKLDFAVWLCDRPPVIAPLVHRPALYVCSLWYLQVQSNGNSLACKSRVNDENNRANNYKCNKTALFSNSNWFNLSWNKRSANILSDEIITPCSIHVLCIHICACAYAQRPGVNSDRRFPSPFRRNILLFQNYANHLEWTFTFMLYIFCVVREFWFAIAVVTCVNRQLAG